MYYINIVSSQNSVVFCILNSNSFTNEINTCYLTHLHTSQFFHTWHVAYCFSGPIHPIFHANPNPPWLRHGPFPPFSHNDIFTTIHVQKTTISNSPKSTTYSFRRHHRHGWKPLQKTTCRADIWPLGFVVLVENLFPGTVRGPPPTTGAYGGPPRCAGHSTKKSISFLVFCLFVLTSENNK